MRISGNIINPQPDKLRSRLSDAFSAQTPVEISILPDRVDIPRDVPGILAYRVLVHMLIDRGGDGYHATGYREGDDTIGVTIDGSLPAVPRATVSVDEIGQFQLPDDDLPVHQ